MTRYDGSVVRHRSFYSIVNVVVLSAMLAVACRRNVDARPRANSPASSETRRQATAATSTANTPAAASERPRQPSTATSNRYRTHATYEDFVAYERSVFQRETGELIGPFGFEPRPDRGDPPRTSATTKVRLCPPHLVDRDDDILRSDCPVVGNLEAGVCIEDARSFPSGRTSVLVLEREFRFYDLASRRLLARRTMPSLGPSHGRWTFTPGGRLLVVWSAGTCLGESALFDDRGSRLDCAGIGEIAPDGHHLLEWDSEPLCGIEGARVRIIDLDTCRTSETIALTPLEAQTESTSSFDSDGATIRIGNTRSIRIHYPSRP